MTLVPVYPFDCKDSGSAPAFHECARIAADLAHKALAPFFKPIRYWSYERDGWFESGSLQRRVNCELVLRQVALAASTKNISPIEMSWLSLSAYQLSV